MADVLKRLRGEPKIHKYATIDLEARGWIYPYAIGFYDGNKYSSVVRDGFVCIREMLEQVLIPEYAGYWIYAHNGGNYDFLFLVRVLLSTDIKRRYRVELTPAGSTIIKMDVVEIEEGKHRGDCLQSESVICAGCADKRTGERLQRWTFLDSAKLMPLPLSELGEAFAITKKIKLSMSYDDLAKPENRTTMERYLEVDCRSLHQAIGVMREKIGGLGGQIGITLPATSLDLFRRVYQREDIHTNRHWLRCPDYDERKTTERCIGNPDDDEDETSCLHAFVRQAYFGGPSQIFTTVFVGEKALQNRTRLSDTEIASYDAGHPVAKMYDINSHYPGQMLAPMPVSRALELDDQTEDSIVKNAVNNVGIVECDVEIPEDTYLPPLPVNHNGKLIFPAGRLRGVWDASELCLLRRVGGRIVNVRRSIWYQTAPVFVDFVREIYKLRDKSKATWSKAMDWIAKILLNAGYGKFAMREARTKILLHPQLREGLKCLDFNSDVWSEDVTVSPSYVIPQLSVHITALARVKLWELLQGIVDKGGRIYYTDTDSVVCSGVDLPVGPGLGALKLEATIHRAGFVLPKLYLIETDEPDKRKTEERFLRIKSKGMGPGIRLGVEGDDPLDKQLSEEEFYDVTERGLPLARHRITRLKESLKAFAKSATEFPRIVPADKAIQSAYDKRTVLPDFTTKPLVLSQW